MTLTVDVSEKLEERLEAEARREGVSKDEFVRRTLEEKLGLESEKPDFPSRIIAADLPVRDFSRQHEWLEKNRDEYEGQHVALDGDKLIAAGFDAKEVARKARASGINGLYFAFVEPKNSPPFISGGIRRE